MLDLKNPKVAIPIVLIAGVFWSFGPYVVRHIDQPQTVPWQYLFTRGLVIFLLLNMYLFLEEGKDFYKNYFKVGISGIVGGIGLGTAMITFIWSITNTTAAITLLLHKLERIHYPAMKSFLIYLNMLHDYELKFIDEDKYVLETLKEL